VGVEEAGYFAGGSRIWVRRAVAADGETHFALDRVSGKAVHLPARLAGYEGWLWFPPAGKHAIGLPSESERRQDRVDVIRIDDGKIVGGFSSGGLWHRRSPRGTEKEPLFNAWPGRTVFSADGGLVLLTRGEHATEMGLWDVATGERLQTFREQPSTK
jgi:hypothetical protein